MHDIYQNVTNHLIVELEKGTMPWVQPWSSRPDPVPCNAVSNRRYNGINNLILTMEAASKGYASNRWLTFRQALMLGGHVRAGERSTPILFYRLSTVAEATDKVLDDIRRLPFLKTHAVFSLDQVWLPDDFINPPPANPPFAPIAMAEQLVTGSGATIRHQGYRAFYTPASDIIFIPEKTDFNGAMGYYQTLLHELCHWTGHISRLDRSLGRRFGEESYAVEELIAELGASFLSAHGHIDGHLQHAAAYLASWLEVLQRDKKAIFVAAALAQKACDFLLKRAGLLTPDQDLSQAA